MVEYGNRQVNGTLARLHAASQTLTPPQQSLVPFCRGSIMLFVTLCPLCTTNDQSPVARAIGLQHSSAH